MTTTQDVSVGIGVESTFKTGVTPTRWFENVDETLDWNKAIKQGKGVRSGSRVARSGRRVVTSAMGSGDVTVECVSKGMGLWWQALLGAGSSALVSGTTFQQLFTLGDNPASVTAQKGLVRIDPVTGAGTVDAYTFLGCMVDSWELDFTNDDIALVKASLNAADITTATAYAAPSYPTAPNLFQFANCSIASGVLTPPTATSLASGTTTVADVRGGSINVNNNLTTRLNIGGSGRQARPTQGLRSISGKVDIEYDSTTFRDAVLNDTPMALILTYTAGALSTGVETLQVVLPEIKFDSELPKMNGTDLITQSMAFQVLDNLTATQPIWVVCRTSDNAL